VYSKDSLDVIEEPVRGEKDQAGKIIRPDNVYVICADTSRGLGGDYHAFTVIDITNSPYRVVAKYRNNKVAPVLYPSFIHTVAKNYNNAFVLIEINDNGQQVADIMYNELEYENLLFVTRDTQVGQIVGGGFGRHGQTQNGVRTDKKVKRIGCSMLKTLIESGRLLAMDKDIISEFATFIESKDSYAADEGYHDDLVMTLVLFSWLTTNAYFRDLTDINIRTSLFENQIRQIESELTPFGFIDDGSGDDEPKYIYEAGDLWTVEKRAQNWL